VNGDTALVEALVSAGADVNLQCIHGNTPLGNACNEGNIDVVKLSVLRGAEVVQFLIEQNADVDACLNDGESCLLIAAFHGHADVVHALVSAKASWLVRKDTLML